MKYKRKQPKAGPLTASRPFAFKRLAFNIASAISLGLSIAVMVLWLRSYDHCDIIIHQHSPADRVGVTSEFGRLVFEVEEKQTAAIAPGWVYFDKSFPRRWRRPGQFLGFDAYTGKVRHYLLLPATPLWGFTVPHLFVALLSGGLLFRWLWVRGSARLARGRLAHGQCTSCGYDLRASTLRCPECGTAFIKFSSGHSLDAPGTG